MNMNTYEAQTCRNPDLVEQGQRRKSELVKGTVVCGYLRHNRSLPDGDQECS